MELTNEQVKTINKMVSTCKYKQMGVVCFLMCLPCDKVIDKGKCPEIISYLKKIGVRE